MRRAPLRPAFEPRRSTFENRTNRTPFRLIATPSRNARSRFSAFRKARKPLKPARSPDSPRLRQLAPSPRLRQVPRSVRSTLKTRPTATAKRFEKARSFLASASAPLKSTRLAPFVATAPRSRRSRSRFRRRRSQTRSARRREKRTRSGTAPSNTPLNFRQLLPSVRKSRSTKPRPRFPNRKSRRNVPSKLENPFYFYAGRPSNQPERPELSPSRFLHSKRSKSDAFFPNRSPTLSTKRRRWSPNRKALLGTFVVFRTWRQEPDRKSASPRLDDFSPFSSRRRRQFARFAQSPAFASSFPISPTLTKATVARPFDAARRERNIARKFENWA